jgi:hypothetical protein
MDDIINLQAYVEAARVIKDAILRSQYRAVSSANKEQLSLYYGIGCYVSKNSREGFWGKGAIESISKQLQKELPGLRGFSATNIKNMRSFYEEWSVIINRQPMADENKTVVCYSELDEQMLLMKILRLAFCYVVMLINHLLNLPSEIMTSQWVLQLTEQRKICLNDYVTHCLILKN